jgi:hypothetical protein
MVSRLGPSVPCSFSDAGSAREAAVYEARGDAAGLAAGGAQQAAHAAKSEQTAAILPMAERYPWAGLSARAAGDRPATGGRPQEQQRGDHEQPGNDVASHADAGVGAARRLTTSTIRRPSARSDPDQHLSGYPDECLVGNGSPQASDPADRPRTPARSCSSYPATQTRTAAISSQSNTRWADGGRETRDGDGAEIGRASCRERV